ncbi:hypothetical protein [Pseudomonas umsongensis]|uniref:hypothetical protein n=1 Tax=Pseudomonas umsongensis TaxID=198618 RepID=UPI000374EDDE|nr:hypothetical protein [Pseudomonas umsongensis]
MRVANIFLFTVGPKGNAPIPSVLGIYLKYANRDTTNFIGWFHLTATAIKGGYSGSYQQIFMIDKSGDTSEDHTKISEIAAKFAVAEQPQGNTDLKTLKGDIGAIVIAHGSCALAGTLSPDKLAYTINNFRVSTGLTQQFRKIVLDVCNVGQKAGVFKKTNKKYNGITFQEDEPQQEHSEEEDEDEQNKLNFLQAFLAVYGPLSKDAGTVSVAGWDSGISVFHPDNEYFTNKVSVAQGNTANVSNPAIVDSLQPGQKFFSNRERTGSHSEYTLGLIDNETRKTHKKIYNYASVEDPSSTGRIVQLKIKDWSDKEK